jgi:hypothetical protein
MQLASHIPAHIRVNHQKVTSISGALETCIPDSDGYPLNHKLHGPNKPY